MDHLFNNFEQKGIHAFRDNNDLPRGEYISPQLYKAIEESRCKKIENPKYEVQIIFYDVKPTVVRKQTGSYAEAFAQHDVLNRAEVGKWKEALCVAYDLSGFDLQEMTNGFMLDGPLDVAENLVSVDARVRELNLLRFVGSDKVHMIGICGFSGIRKTNLAKAIYNSMYTYFEGRCFCDDVQGVTKRQGLTQVQMQRFVKILKTESLKISSVSEGTKVIKQRMALTQQPQAEFPQLDTGLAVPTFQQGEDLVDCINKAMTFLSVVASRFPPSNSQLRTSSNPRNQATIQDGIVTVQQVQGRQTQSFASIRNRGIATTSRGNYAASQPREKLMLAKAHEADQILDEEQLAFLADPRIEEVQVAQQKIP
ncbi:NB-ARC domains-containing protein [Tanacetum coccineum]